MTEFGIVIGNKRYSSWSLRAWILLKHLGVAFDETVIPLRQADTRAKILAHSPGAKVPALKHRGLVVWESLAIGEYLAELFPDAGLWPKDGALRAEARAIACEMHAGFQALRRDMPMICTGSKPGVGHTVEALADAARVQEIWRSARRKAQDGPFLFGRFGIADAMYAPVVFRFNTYAPPLDDVARAYVENMLNFAPMRAWLEGARAETWRVAEYEPTAA